MIKLLLILAITGAVASSLGAAQSQPPLLIDSAPSPASLDASN